MKKLIAKDLKIKFIEAFNESSEFTYEEGNPFIVKIRSKHYYIFLKNLSPAYFKNSPDVTRVQLPFSTHFSKITKAQIPFIILGYDADFDVLVTWDPAKIRERLNSKNNVSLYSRRSLQKIVKNDELNIGHLSNGDKFVIFKRNNLPNFFDRLQYVFSKKRNPQLLLKNYKSHEPIIKKTDKTIRKIKDKRLLKKLQIYLQKNQVLQAVEVVSKYYSGKYKNMGFKDWYALVNELHNT